MDTSETVAATIRAELARRRKSQRELAEALGVSQIAISRRLTGATTLDVNDLAKIAAFLDVPIEFLLGEVAAS